MAKKKRAKKTTAGRRRREPNGQLTLKQRLVLDTFKGTIQLSAWDANSIQISARIYAPDDVSAQYARDSVSATEVQVTGDSRSLGIRSDYDAVTFERKSWFSRSKVNPYIDYDIRAPRDLRLFINDHKSTIEITGFEGVISIETHKGTVIARDLKGKIKLETHKGDAELSNLEGRFEVSTYKGTVEIEPSTVIGPSSVETHKGTVRVRLLSGVGVDVTANVGRKGELDSDFALSVSRGDRRRAPSVHHGKINGGGSRLTMSTYKGSLELSITSLPSHCVLERR